MVSAAPAMARAAWAGLLLSGLLLLSGCAQPARHPGSAADTAFWSGRLALSIQSEPAQALSAGFELRGAASQGELQLFSPLGGTLAVLAWNPDRATLRLGTQAQESGSVSSLVLKATGTEIPVQALFDWLNNIPTQVDGWQVDLSQLCNGRLQLRRSTPVPAVELRLKFDL
jgi:outer membrane lipoprotein LolB